jgi:hypothetical protein
MRIAGSRCTLVWVDEWYGRPRSLRFVDAIPVEDIAAIEIYRTYRDVPEELRIHVYPCGLINVWTRAAW